MFFARAVVMKKIMLASPGFRENPIEPVNKTPPALGEATFLVPFGDTRHLIVGAVTDVVHQVPSRQDSLSDEKRTQRVGNNPGRCIAKNRAQSSEPLHFQKMAKIVVAKGAEGIAAQRVDFPAEAFVVDVSEFRCFLSLHDPLFHLLPGFFSPGVKGPRLLQCPLPTA